MSSKPRLIERSKIDIEKWRYCCEKSIHTNVYVLDWFLDIMCEGNWVALVLDDYKAIMPLPARKKWGFVPYIYQPFFTQQLGIFALPEVEFNSTDFINAIPKKFVKVHLQIHNEIPELSLKSKNNYILHLNKSYAELEKKYSRDARKNLSRCEDLLIDHQVSIEEIVQLNREVWGQLNPGVKENDYNKFIRVCHAAETNNSLIKIRATRDNELHGLAIFLIGGRRMHYLCGAPTPKGREHSSMHGIIDYVIRKNADTGMILDFEGSEIPNVASFYKKFGAVKENYFVFKR